MMPVGVGILEGGGIQPYIEATRLKLVRSRMNRKGEGRGSEPEKHRLMTGKKKNRFKIKKREVKVITGISILGRLIKTSE